MSISLAVKYRPQTLEEVVGQDITTTILSKQLEDKTFKNAYLFVGHAGCGKAQPLDSKVLTPDGFINMGDIKIGQKVITGSGNLGEVSGIFPQGVRDIYEIILQDRTKIRVSDEHLNIVYRYNQYKKVKEDFTLTTLDLIKLFETSKFNLRIDCPSVDFPYKDVPIDPYLLGALIGDGTLRNNNMLSFSNSEDDVIAKVNNILSKEWSMYLKHQDKHDYRLKYIEDNPYIVKYKDKTFNTLKEAVEYLNSIGYDKVNPDNIHAIANNEAKAILKKHPELKNEIIISPTSKPLFNNLNTLRNKLSELGLLCKSVDKHIPHIYLYNSVEVRLKLLQGLFDTDGTISKEGTPSFETSSKTLSDDFATLVRSLGIRDTVSIRKGKYKKDGKIHVCNDSYRHYLSIPYNLQFYSSIKHSLRATKRKNPCIRNIVAINKVGQEECQCIYINHPDHTYISDYFIPTHNTSVGRIFAKEINGGNGQPIEIDAASNNGADDVRKLVSESNLQSIIGDYKVYLIDEVHAYSNAAWQAMLKILEEPPLKTIFILCTTDPQKIPATVLSRLQIFKFNKISHTLIYNRLIEVLKEEKIKNYEEPAIELIAKMADGGMRDALTYLDKILAYDANITLHNVEETLGMVPYNLMFDLFVALFTNKQDDVIRIFEDINRLSIDLKQFVNQFLTLVLDIYSASVSGETLGFSTTPSMYEDTLMEFSSTSKDGLLKLIKVLLELSSEIKYDVNAKYTILAKLLLEMK